MAVMLNEWIKRYPDLDRDTLKDWVTDASIQGKTGEEIDKFIKQKLGIGTPVENLPEDDIEDDEYMEDDEDLPNPVEAERKMKQMQAQAGELQRESKIARQIKAYEEKVRHESKDVPIPYENPDLSEIEVPDDEEDIDEDVEEEPEPPKPRIRPQFNRTEMITKTITIQEYENLIRPFKPLFDGIREDNTTLNKIATQIDSKNMPHYMQLKPYLINHPIKDPNNTKVLLNVISEDNPKAIVRRFVSVTEAIDIIRPMAAAGHHQASYDNYQTVLEKLMEDRSSLVSLIYMLENYTEMKQISPFELSIPKQILVQTIEESFGAIKTLITENVLRELSTMKNDLKGEMGDVGSIVEKNMTKFDSQIQEAVTRVLWKVKTDVESTNMEDIKKSLLFILNKRAAAYNFGGMATALIGVMLDDLERQLLETGFKLDNIKEYRRYTIDDLTRRLGYKKETMLTRVIPILVNRKLIRIYENRTISL